MSILKSSVAGKDVGATANGTMGVIGVGVLEVVLRLADAVELVNPIIDSFDTVSTPLLTASLVVIVFGLTRKLAVRFGFVK